MARFILRMACRKCNARFDAAMSLRLENQESEETRNFMNQADDCFGKGLYKEALQFLSVILKKTPFHERATAFTGSILLHHGNVDDAVYWLSLSVRVNPLVAATHASLAEALAVKRNFLGAMLHMKEAWKLSKIENDPDKKHKLSIFKILAN